jgi:hypothetical protein
VVNQGTLKGKRDDDLRPSRRFLKSRRPSDRGGAGRRLTRKYARESG